MYLELISTAGIKPAILGMRNPLDSRGKIDSNLEDGVLGDNDLSLLLKLCRAGGDHRKAIRMMKVYFDISAPLFLYKELDTYQVGVNKNSGSTMHTLHKKKIDKDSFCMSEKTANRQVVRQYLEYLEDLRREYVETKDKTVWRELVELLPDSFFQYRTYEFSYEALVKLLKARENHKLEEWHEVCSFIRSNVPYINEIYDAIYTHKNIEDIKSNAIG